jgi:hypothetical protein
MKRVFTTIVLAVLIAGVSNAQSASGGFRRAGTNAQIKAMQTKKLQDSLGLTEDQSKNVDAIQQDYMLRMRAVKMNSQISDEEKKTQLASIRAERKEKLQTIISEDQLAKMDNQRPKVKKAQGSSKVYSSKKKKSKKRYTKKKNS